MSNLIVEIEQVIETSETTIPSVGDQENDDCDDDQSAPEDDRFVNEDDSNENIDNIDNKSVHDDDVGDNNDDTTGDGDGNLSCHSSLPSSSGELGLGSTAATTATTNTTTTSTSIADQRVTQWREGVKCPKCIYVGHSATRLEQHFARVHDKDTTYKCRLCDFTCKWNREYYKHMKCHYDGPPYKCEECDYTCDRIQFILSHYMRHTDERPFHCDRCQFKSRTKGNLVVHMRIHTGEKPYECQHCPKRFAMKNTLDQHLATHTDERPYLCETCGFTTKYQSHLLSHKRIHTGNVFRCNVMGCSYFSPRRSQLDAHMRSHYSQRDHTCKRCGRGFIERSHLIRHERIHTGYKPYKCELCDYASTRRDKLKEHVSKHHSGDKNVTSGSKQVTTYRNRRQPHKRHEHIILIEDNSLQDLAEGQVIITSPQEIQLTSSEQDLATANLIFECTSNFDAATQIVIQNDSNEFTADRSLVFDEKIQ